MNKNIKKPSLKLQKVYVVEEWATEIKEGYGLFLPKLKNNFSQYTNTYLVWNKDGLPESFNSRLVYDDYEKAVKALEKTRLDYIKWLNDQVIKYQNQIKEIAK